MSLFRFAEGIFARTARTGILQLLIPGEKDFTNTIYFLIQNISYLSAFSGKRTHYLIIKNITIIHNLKLRFAQKLLRS